MPTRFMHRCGLTAAALGAALALDGCQAREPARVTAAADVSRNGWFAGAPATWVTQLTSEVESNAGVVQADAAISSRIRSELAADPDLHTLDIRVDMRSGRALLSGMAPSESARDRATRLAIRVEGVVGVDNQLTVPR